MSDSVNIVLCGFMGTGKTTVGPRLADRLGGRFVDLDDALEQRFGMPIHRVFAERGEEAFRAAERDLCARVGSLGAVVVAVGGGAVVDAANREALARFGEVVCLTASVDSLERRLTPSRHRRPMLQTEGSLKDRIRTLLESRRAAYQAIGWQIDTTGRTPQQVCEAIEATLSLRPGLGALTRLAVAADNGHYDVCVGAGALHAVGSLLRTVAPQGGTVALVTNPVVRAHHGEALVQALSKADFDVSICEVPEGERYKTLETVASLYERFIELGLDRHGTVVALGGGVVGDMAGFAAATYLRGVRVVQVPTTLLAMVDASVGGKTGVDLPAGKNLVGAFKQPAMVVADPLVLATLPEDELHGGMAEVIKHGIIDAPALFERLCDPNVRVDSSFLAEAIRVKVDVVNEDPLEQGRRAVLNLGHTFAHGFEKVSGYRIGHGAAVGVGLRAAARLGQELGLTDRALEDAIVRALERWHLPVRFDGLSLADVRAAMGADKKRVGRRLRFVVPRAIGEVTIVEAPDEDAVVASLSAVLAP